MRQILECEKVDFPRSRYNASRELEKYAGELYDVVIGIDTGLSYNYDYAIDCLEIAFVGQCYSKIGKILKCERIKKGDVSCVVLLLRSRNQNPLMN